MKRYLLLAFICSCFFSHAQTKIVFNALTYGQNLQQASKNGKMVLLYFHFKGCGGCAEMEKTTFKDKNAAAFYNSNFIRMGVDVLDSTDMKVSELYNVKTCPSYLFVNSAGKMQHKAVGVFSPKEFIAIGRKALDTTGNLGALERRYQHMKHDSAFMLDYCHQLRDAYAVNSEAVNGYLATQKNLSSDKNLRFLYEFSLVEYELMIGMTELNFMLAHRREFYPIFDSIRVAAKIVWVTNFIIDKAINDQNEQLFSEACAAMKEFDNGQEYEMVEMDGRTTGMMATSGYQDLYYKMLYFDKGKDVIRYRDARNAYLAKIWDKSDDLNSYAWSVYENSTDKEKLTKALECAKRSVELIRKEENVDTYTKLQEKVNQN